MVILGFNHALDDCLYRMRHCDVTMCGRSSINVTCTTYKTFTSSKDLYARQISVSCAKNPEEQTGHLEMNFIPFPCYEFSLSQKRTVKVKRIIYYIWVRMDRRTHKTDY